jgi:hypothetical protein
MWWSSSKSKISHEKTENHKRYMETPIGIYILENQNRTKSKYNTTYCSVTADRVTVIKK